MSTNFTKITESSSLELFQKEKYHMHFSKYSDCVDFWKIHEFLRAKQI